MPEKVTSLNGLKVTSEYWSYTLSALNKDYVKLLVLLITYQSVTKKPNDILLHPIIFYKEEVSASLPTGKYDH
ncbi:hypothetical protein CGE66_20440 [Salmonella enterica]|nr:hypothetical protein [Salmonella enterica]ECX7228385.1 hypothetical protein [Salmonella enterica]ECX8703875.1 hypothetical protein [Salmonella enterica]EGB2188493.1 hypothetical protein [Salmonella enterica]EIS8589479.1 hypothetical protein [Salmonella enterica]